MPLKILSNKRLHIPFIDSFKHASACRNQSSSFWVEVHSDKHIGYGEGCPRPYVSDETLDSAEAFLLQKQADICAEINDLAALKIWVTEHRQTIDSNPAAWCAIELALLDLFAKESNQTVESLLELPDLSGPFYYSAVLGDSEIRTFEAQLHKYVALDFTDFKIKLSGNLNKDKDKFTLMTGYLNNTLRIRADANNFWRCPNEAIDYLLALKTPLFGIEEPVITFQYSDMAKIAVKLGTRIILDESFLCSSQFNRLTDSPESWIINLRISKMGGLLRSLEVIEQAKKLGIKIIIGAHVGETSLLTRAALPLAMAADSILIAQEGAFGTLLLKQDVVSTPLVFGRKGVLNPERFIETERNGFGLKFRLPDH